MSVSTSSNITGKRGKSVSKNKRDKASFGKREEFIAIAELLKRDYDVYKTLVDDQGIDCVVRVEKANQPPYYLDLQVKARSGRRFNLDKVRTKNRGNLFFILYCEQDEVHWIIPATDLPEVAIKHEDGFIVNVPPLDSKSKRRKDFEKYLNRFEQLAYYDPENDFDPIEETNEIMADKKLSQRLLKRLKETRPGKTIAWEDVKRRALR